MLTLRQLDAAFLKREDDRSFRFVETIGEADGVEFLCPKCYSANRGAAGTHAIICWSPHVPQTTSPTGGRWALQGRGLDDLSLLAASSSVLLSHPNGCKAHFFVKDGRIAEYGPA